MRVALADIADPCVRELAAYHQQDMHRASPPGTDFALDVSGLEKPGITIIGAWEGDTLIAMGALKRLAGGQAELKSMRTHPDHLGKGAASAILEALIAMAAEEGTERLSLETGTAEAFQPAIKLYTKRGFAAGEDFAQYVNGPHNQCYHLDLKA